MNDGLTIEINGFQINEFVLLTFLKITIANRLAPFDGSWCLRFGCLISGLSTPSTAPDIRKKMRLRRCSVSTSSTHRRATMPLDWRLCKKKQLTIHWGLDKDNWLVGGGGGDWWKLLIGPGTDKDYWLDKWLIKKKKQFRKCGGCSLIGSPISKSSREGRVLEMR